MFKPITTILFCTLVVDATWAQCTRLPDGTWQCPPADGNAAPSAMDIRIECPTARGSGTAVARFDGGGTLVVTNHHVIGGQSTITLHATGGRRAAGSVVAVDQANDLAAIAVGETWPVVTLGGELAIGTQVQFRAFDSGTTFRKYYGQIVGEYRGAGGGGGFFATGRSVPGNSGGGVYSQGQLVGVVWGNPDGGTALVPIAPVRRLIERATSRHWQQQPTFPQSGPQSTPITAPITTPITTPDGALPQVCDCDERWRQVESRLAELQHHESSSPALADQLDWFKIAAAAAGFSGPIGAAIFGAGLLLRFRSRHSRSSHATRGLGGPRDETFHSHQQPTSG